MKQREEKIESQRSIKMIHRQVIARPRAQKNECGESGECLNSYEPAFG